jgi:hypothetical protein
MTARKPPRALFHWSPTERRDGITRRGLLPGQPRSTHVGPLEDPDYRAPFVCLAEDPAWAWELSGIHRPDVESWDLWQVHLADGHKLRCVLGVRMVHEWRVYDRIHKRGVLYVATRTTGSSR